MKALTTILAVLALGTFAVNAQENFVIKLRCCFGNDGSRTGMKANG